MRSCANSIPMHIRISEDARADLRSIRDYIKEHDPAAAARVVTILLTSISQLEDFPLLGRPGRVDGTRELAVPRVPYLVIYTLPDAYHVDVERVLHARLKYP